MMLGLTFSRPTQAGRCYPDEHRENHSYSAMTPILTYAAPAKRRLLRPIAGACATVTALVSSSVIVTATFYTRYALASYVGGGRCGTPRATMEAQLYYVTPVLLVVPMLAYAVADHFQYNVSVCRASLCIAALGWIVCAFVG